MKYWISETSLPDQYWAIIDEIDGKIVVKYADKIIEYSSVEDAEHELIEDEFVNVDKLTKKDEIDLEVPLAMLTPPLNGEPLCIKSTCSFEVKALNLVYGIGNYVCRYTGCNENSLKGKYVCAFHYSNTAYSNSLKMDS